MISNDRQAKRSWVRPREKGGNQREMPCHHALAEALRAFIDEYLAAGTAVRWNGNLCGGELQLKC